MKRASAQRCAAGSVYPELWNIKFAIALLPRRKNFSGRFYRREKEKEENGETTDGVSASATS